MNQTNPRNENNENNVIMTAFHRLLHYYQSHESKIATKEEEAEKAKNQELLAKTRDYTVDNIINGMAALQLSFGSIVNQLTNNLSTESDKLAELHKAIAVEQKYLEQLRQIRLVADALHILHQEHQEKITFLANQTTAKIEAVTKEIAVTKKEWQKEQVEFETKVKETTELLIKQREAEEADYQYELKRQRTIEGDEYEENKRLQTRELAEMETVKERDWLVREKYLAEHKQEFLKNQELITEFVTKLAEEYNKAKGNAIKEADNKYKIEAEMQAKEWSAQQQGYELKLTSLTAVIERQNQQIVEITTQLQEVNSQAQSLAMQAFN